MKRIVALLFTLTFSLTLFSHPWKPKHFVIIDTDAGIDDMKAITMLLASPDVRVLAITVSPGALNSGAGYLKVKSLLNGFYHEGLPVAINSSCSYKSPDFPSALNYRWGDEQTAEAVHAPDYKAILSELIDADRNKITMICLGGLSTASSAFSEIPQFRQKVKRIIWSADGIADKKGFNYNIDAGAVSKILESGIPVTVVKGTGNLIFYDSDLIQKISGLNSIYSKRVTEFFGSESAKEHKYSYTLNDESVPVYMHYPELFRSDTSRKTIEAAPGNISGMRDKTLQILKGETVERNQVIKDIPLTPGFYFADIEPSVTEIINKYGPDEWTSAIIANELHRHLGVFAIIGVKMGIRAREYFNTGVDEFMVTSSAGSTPPLSCMNDGLQVSTGATPGHGLLTVRNEAPLSPSAEFIYLNSKIRLTLRPEIAALISNELKEINFVHGLDSDIYWELVRKNSIKYWLNLDRHDIFIIEKL